MRKLTLVYILLVRFLSIQAQNGWIWEQEDPFFLTTTTKNPKPIPTTTWPPIPSPTPDRNFRRCLKRCPTTSEYNPVCGTDNITYDNIGKLLCSQKCGSKIDKSRDGICSGETQTTTQSTLDLVCLKRCPKTSEYTPICGSDGVTYMNDNQLRCAQQCGAGVEKVLVGPCGGLTSSTSSRPSTKTTSLPTNFRACIRQCIVSSLYQPVCASDGKTYNNDSELQCDITCGKKIQKVRNGAC